MAQYHSQSSYSDIKPHSQRRAPLDELGDAAFFNRLLEGQSKAVDAVRSAEYQLTGAITASMRVMERANSRLIYCAAGTCGRVALLDGVELSPAFNWPSERIRFIIGGGIFNFSGVLDGSEQNGALAHSALEQITISENDIIVAISASGTTPFVVSAIEMASDIGALCIGFSNTPGSPVLANADCPIFLDTGEEAVTGSTRLAAATSQKIALNIYSTALMVRLGKVYRGQMVDMRVTNTDLEAQAVVMVCDIVGCSQTAARSALAVCGFKIKQAILIARGATVEQAQKLLIRHDDRLAGAIEELVV